MGLRDPSIIKHRGSMEQREGSRGGPNSVEKWGKMRKGRRKGGGNRQQPPWLPGFCVQSTMYRTYSYFLAVELQLYPISIEVAVLKTDVYHDGNGGNITKERKWAALVKIRCQWSTIFILGPPISAWWIKSCGLSKWIELILIQRVAARGCIRKQKGRFHRQRF